MCCLFAKHSQEFVGILLSNPEAGDVGRDRQKFVLSLPADRGLWLDEEYSFRAKHCGVNPFGAGVEVDECNTTLGNKDAGFIGGDKLAFFVNLPIVVVIDTISRVAGAFVYAVVTIVVDAVGIPLRDLS